jgi:hypothetical protein
MQWIRVSKRHPVAVSLYSRHYSSTNKEVSVWLRYGITQPGESMTLLLDDETALFVWVKPRYTRSGETGVNCAVFRNECPDHSSSKLIVLACEIALTRWPGERLYTYVDETKISSTNPGFCFIKAGWRRLPYRTKAKNLVVLEYIGTR